MYYTGPRWWNLYEKPRPETTTAQLWRAIAKRRKLDGDHEGARRARRNATFAQELRHLKRVRLLKPEEVIVHFSCQAGFSGVLCGNWHSQSTIVPKLVTCGNCRKILLADELRARFGKTFTRKHALQFAN